MKTSTAVSDAQAVVDFIIVATTVAADVGHGAGLEARQSGRDPDCVLAMDTDPSRI